MHDEPDTEATNEDESEPPTWEDEPSSVIAPPKRGADPVSKDVRGDTMRVAIAGSLSSGALPFLTQLCTQLGSELERPTSGHLMVSYDELLRGVQQGDFHVMWLPPLVARGAIANGAARALAIPVRGGTTGYATVLFTRDDSPIEGVEQLAGTSVGWVDHHSLAGYVLPRALLRERGLPLDDLFASEQTLGSHQAVVAAVVAGDVQVGATHARVERTDSGERVTSTALMDTPTRILARHGPVPADIVAVGRDVDEATRDRLEQILVATPDAPVAVLFRKLIECDSFAPFEPSHMRVLDEVARDDARSEAPTTPSEER